MRAMASTTFTIGPPRVFRIAGRSRGRAAGQRPGVDYISAARRRSWKPGTLLALVLAGVEEIGPRGANGAIGASLGDIFATRVTLSDTGRAPKGAPKMRPILFLLVVVGAGAVAAIRLLPWWALLAAFAGGVLAVPVLFRWALPRLLKAPFRAKGAVLRGATVRVHSAERTRAPAVGSSGEDEAGAADRGPREHYRIEVTITPRPAEGPFRLWAPGELVLVGPS